MGKMYAGNPPANGDGWTQVGKCLDGDKVEWLVFSKPQDHSPEWVTFKVCANGRAINKANYWMVRNMQTGKIGFAKDYLLLHTNRPKLAARVDAMLKKASSKR